MNRVNEYKTAFMSYSTSDLIYSGFTETIYSLYSRKSPPWLYEIKKDNIKFISL
jgi:hypothetical protein